jgi:hypothetical protein
VSGRIPSVALAGALLMGVAASGAPAAGATSGERHETLDTLSVEIRPTSGPAGTVADVRGQGFLLGGCFTVLTFTDADGVITDIGSTSGAHFKTRVTIPTSAAIGAGSVLAREWLFNLIAHRCLPRGPQARATFTVTG